MSNVVSVFVQPFVNHADKWITGKINDILGVEEEVKKIFSNLSCILAVLETEGGSKEDNALLNDRLKKLERVVVDAQDVLDTYETEVALWQINKKTSRLRKAGFKSKLAERIKKISKTLQIIDGENKMFNTSKDRVIQKPGKEEEFREKGSTFATGRDDFIGRKEVKDRLISQMTSKRHVKDPINVFPIIGLPGLGKTSLAQQIYNDEAIEKHFGEARMWASITVHFDYDKFLDDELSSFLKEKKICDFLLVLDDLQDIGYDQLARLTTLLKEKCMKSVLLVTTQRRNLARKFLAQDPSPESYLPELPEDDCMELFRRVAFPNGLPEDLEEYSWKIIRKCSGLPLAVKAIAWALKGNSNEDEWKDIVESELWKLEQRTSTSDKPKVLPVLRLAYNHLPDSFTRQCFAYCSVFPKGYAFEKKELVKLWMAQAFTDPRKTEKYEKIGNNYFDQLFRRSFFQIVHIDNKVRYRLHELMHELALSVSSSQCCQVKDHKSCHFSDELLHASFLSQDVDKLVEKIVAKSKKLRTLLWRGASLKNPDKALDKIFKTLKSIRVLDLSSSSLEKLPKSVAKLKLLRYLDLSNTKIRVLPDSICSLYNLQTLKLLGCVWLLELPKDLEKLVNLRHLELDDIFWYYCTKLPPNMGNITGLHNLHVFPVGTSGLVIEELKNMGYLTGNLHISKLENAVNAAECKLNEKESLEKVVLEWSEEYVHQQDEVAVMQDLQPHSNLKGLEIHHFKGSSFPSWLIGGYLKNLVTLSLNHCTNCRKLSVGQLNRLTNLYIKGMLELDEWPEADRCTSLLNLKISNCPRLRILPFSMPMLRSLKIKYCHSLKALPVTPSVKFLLLIDNFVLEDWREATLFLNRGPFILTGPTSYGSADRIEINKLPQDPSVASEFLSTETGDR